MRNPKLIKNNIMWLNVTALNKRVFILKYEFFMAWVEGGVGGRVAAEMAQCHEHFQISHSHDKRESRLHSYNLQW